MVKHDQVVFEYMWSLNTGGSKTRFHTSLEATPLPQHRMYCITGTRKGLVDMPYRFRISGMYE